MSKELCIELAKVIAEDQAEARAKLKPRDKSVPQCEKTDGLGMFCMLDAGHEGDHEHYDPILGIV